MSKKKNSKERRQFFEELYQNCSNKDVYSVIETAEAMDVEYDQVKLWASKNKRLNRILQQCRALCAKHVKAEQKSSNPRKDFFRLKAYLIENDDTEARKEEGFRAFIQQENEAVWEAEKKEKTKAKRLRRKIHLNFFPEKKPQQKIDEAKEACGLPVNTKSKEDNHPVRQDARLEAFREKQAKERAEYCFKENETKSTDEVIHLEVKYDDPGLTDSEQNNIVLSTNFAATGSASLYVGCAILTSTLNANLRGTGSDTANICNATQDALLAMAPTDIFEGTLVSRYWTLHNQSMHYMAIASNIDADTQTIDTNINRATKLMRLANETLDALNKHRRKGEQKVIVQHVNVNDGGKAIVNGQPTPSL